jgi:hypothetical protein
MKARTLTAATLAAILFTAVALGAGELRHKDIGTNITKAEWESTDTHYIADGAAGDVLYGGTTGTLVRLPVGSAGQVLVVATGTPKPAWLAAGTAVTPIPTPTPHRYWDNTASGGRLWGGEITSNGDGTVDIAAGAGLIKTDTAALGLSAIPESLNDGQGSVVQEVTWPEITGFTLTDESYNLIYWDASASTMTYATRGNFYTAFDFVTDFTIGRCYRSGDDVVARLCGMNEWDFPRRVQMFGEERFPVERATGLAIDASTTLTYSVTDGVIWAELVNRFPVTGKDEGDPFRYWYQINDAWTSATATTIDNTNYNVTSGDADGLAAMTNNRWRVDYVYVVHDSTHHVVLGQAQYVSQAQAEAATIPTPPGLLSSYASLVGRITTQEGSGTITAASPFTETFAAASLPDHNTLAGLQGGAADDYYHLTAAEVSAALAVPTPGPWVVATPGSRLVELATPTPMAASTPAAYEIKLGRTGRIRSSNDSTLLVPKVNWDGFYLGAMTTPVPEGAPYNENGGPYMGYHIIGGGTGALAVGDFAEADQDYSTMIGNYAGAGSTALTYGTALGYQAAKYARTNSHALAAIGYKALYSATTVDRDGSVAVGPFAGSESAGLQSVMVGYSAGYSGVGSYHALVGSESGDNSGTGASSLCGLGYQSLYETTSAGGIGIGYQAGNGYDGDYGIGIGYRALDAGNGYDYVLAVGRNAEPTAAHQAVIGGPDGYYYSKFFLGSGAAESEGNLQTVTISATDSDFATTETGASIRLKGGEPAGAGGDQGYVIAEAPFSVRENTYPDGSALNARELLGVSPGGTTTVRGDLVATGTVSLRRGCTFNTSASNEDVKVMSNLNHYMATFDVSDESVDLRGDLNVGGDVATTGALTVDGTTLVVDADDHRVGIGTASPVSGLDARDIGYLRVQNSTSGGISLITNSAESALVSSVCAFTRSRGTSASPTTTNSGDNLALFEFYGYNTSNAIVASANMTAKQDGSAGSTYVPGSILFGTSSGSASMATRMTIKSDGSVFVPDVYSDNTAGGAAMLIKSDGQIGRDTSSIRYKDHVVDVPATDLEKLMALRPRKYDRIDGSARGEIGLIAEEVADVMPEIVVYAQHVEEVLAHDAVTSDGIEIQPAQYERVFSDSTEPDGVNYYRLIAPMLSVVQDQQQRIESLEATVAAMDARLRKLEGGR